MARDQAWRNLEERVAQFLGKDGYTTTVSYKATAPNGLTHEIDVYAEKVDGAGKHRVAVECKLWKSPIEKDVVYKLEKVMSDLGLTRGLIVTAGGYRSGAYIAAQNATAHIEVWGPEEIRHYLGDEALAGVALAPVTEADAVPAAISIEAAERLINKARGGFAGFGGLEVSSIDLMWVPSWEFQLAITQVRGGLLRSREEIVRIWNLYEGLTGSNSGCREDGARATVMTAMKGVVLQRQVRSAEIERQLRSMEKKHASANSEAAVERRTIAFRAAGLPAATRRFVVESCREIFVPYFVGALRRRGAESFVAIHAGLGMRAEEIEAAMHARVDVVTKATTAETQPPAPEAVENLTVSTGPNAQTCRCGAAMVTRRRKSDGQEFWGCSTFPKCRNTLPIGG